MNFSHCITCTKKLPENLNKMVSATGKQAMCYWCFLKSPFFTLGCCELATAAILLGRTSILCPEHGEKVFEN